ncbi:MAG: hypothetical protein JRE64_17745 [Deltaproteobacteria bacterium]|nr:hypothetical protein [Deltaproteobacteria bacterium]
MKRNFLLFLLITAFITCLAGMVWAVPIINTSSDSVEDYTEDIGDFSSGDRFAYYQNTGVHFFTGDGNNEGQQFNLGILESIIEDELGFASSDFTLVDTTSAVTVVGVDYDGGGVDVETAASGTFQVNTSLYPGGIEFYAVKAANFYSLYREDGGETNGSWSTYHTWLEKGSGDSLEISHFTGYNGRGVSVPDASVMLLLGSSFLGLAVFGRKKIRTS